MEILNYQFSNRDKVLSSEASVPEAFRDALQEGEVMIHFEIQLLDHYNRRGYEHLEGPAPRVLFDANKKCFPQLMRSYRLAISKQCMIRVDAPRLGEMPSVLKLDESGEVHLESEEAIDLR